MSRSVLHDPGGDAEISLPLPLFPDLCLFPNTTKRADAVQSETLSHLKAQVLGQEFAGTFNAGLGRSCMSPGEWPAGPSCHILPLPPNTSICRPLTTSRKILESLPQGPCSCACQEQSLLQGSLDSMSWASLWHSHSQDWGIETCFLRASLELT